MKEKVENLENKIFNSYNEITKIFDVSVIMNKDKNYSLVLKKKKNGGKDPSDHQLLLMLVSEFKEFKKNQETFNKNQLEFNNFVIDQFRKHGWVK